MRTSEFRLRLGLKIQAWIHIAVKLGNLLSFSEPVSLSARGKRYLPRRTVPRLNELSIEIEGLGSAAGTQQALKKCSWAHRVILVELT